MLSLSQNATRQGLLATGLPRCSIVTVWNIHHTSGCTLMLGITFTGHCQTIDASQCQGQGSKGRASRACTRDADPKIKGECTRYQVAMTYVCPLLVLHAVHTAG